MNADVKRNTPSFDLEGYLVKEGDAKALLFGLMGCTIVPYRCPIYNYSLNDILLLALPKQQVLILGPGRAEGAPKTHIRAIRALFRLQKLRRSI